ncbi:MAG: ribonuclease [Microbacterium sp. SCN 70-200]|uniref:PIN domain-containing protein n=1 Tax=unclassified Microbacterium TaxID=2609290 RepID=UPI0008688EA9|nr:MULTISPECIES: PIN domain-containing protein [unclassified Microbacterium]MBN9215150.1 PIN domain-containing protein [Microbacterium sp.]ODT42573.1 MAG: ribonuclease [Microbacterium sp. SCN 70-200]OJV80084.1 MAG: VapC toxin family PIN domain ribonuclease [Microbacterium sp. 70-16]
MPTSADWLLDTSAAIALVVEDHAQHVAVTQFCRSAVLGLSGHAMLEVYSVLTRLPGAARVTPTSAARIIAQEFPASVPLGPKDALSAVSVLAHAGVAGGAVYDGLVGLAARSAGVTLVTCDRRATPTYAALGVDIHLL